APVQPSAGSFNFAVIGDTHSFRRTWADALATARGRGCSFIIHLGDFVEYDDDIEYDYFLSRTRAEAGDLPVFLTRRNHETVGAAGGFPGNYLCHVARPTYSFEFAGSLFCVVDNSSGTINMRELNELRACMREFRSAHPTSPVFLLMHMPPVLPDFASPDMSDVSSRMLTDL